MKIIVCILHIFNKYILMPTRRQAVFCMLAIPQGTDEKDDVSSRGYIPPERCPQ
jgi:hypothetical protein